MTTEHKRKSDGYRCPKYRLRMRPRNTCGKRRLSLAYATPQNVQDTMAIAGVCDPAINAKSDGDRWRTCDPATQAKSDGYRWCMRPRNTCKKRCVSLAYMRQRNTCEKRWLSLAYATPQNMHKAIITASVHARAQHIRKAMVIAGVQPTTVFAKCAETCLSAASTYERPRRMRSSDGDRSSMAIAVNTRWKVLTTLRVE